MRFFAPASIALCGLSAVTTVLAASHRVDEPLKRRHSAHAVDLVSLGNRSEIHLAERADNARFSFYEVGLGACGRTNDDGENVSVMPLWIENAYNDSSFRICAGRRVKYGGKLLVSFYGSRRKGLTNRSSSNSTVVTGASRPSPLHTKERASLLKLWIEYVISIGC